MKRDHKIKILLVKDKQGMEAFENWINNKSHMPLNQNVIIIIFIIELYI